MNRLPFLLFLLFLLASCTMHEQKTSSIVIKTSPDRDLIYWFSGIDYLSDYEQGYCRSEKAKTDSAGIFVTEFDIDKPVTFNIGRVNKTIMSVLPVHVTPGSRDTIIISGDSIIFNGTNASYNRYLQVTEAFLDYCNQLLIMRPSDDPLFQTKIFSDFEKALNEKRTDAEKKISQSGLDAPFIEEQLAHLDFSSRMAIIVKSLFLMQDSLMPDDWKQAIKKVLNEPIESPYFRSYREISFFLNYYIALDYREEHGNTKDLKYLSFAVFDKLTERLSGKNLECAWATIINNDMCYKKYNPAVPDLYMMLKEKFPENTYQSILNSGIKENYRFNEQSTTDISDDDYQFLSCDSSFISLTDVTAQLKGKVVYVDLWATWCGSCLEQFQYLSALKEKTKDLDIIQLYISIDKPELKERWQKSVYHYSLKGSHLLASPKLRESILKEFGNYIPHYVIVNKDGLIVEPNAPYPEKTDELYEKLLHWSNN